MKPPKKGSENSKASAHLTVWTFRARHRAGLPHHLRKTHHKAPHWFYTNISSVQRLWTKMFHRPRQQNSSSVFVLLEELEQIGGQCQVAAQRLQLPLRGNCTRIRAQAWIIWSHDLTGRSLCSASGWLTSSTGELLRRLDSCKATKEEGSTAQKRFDSFPHSLCHRSAGHIADQSGRAAQEINEGGLRSWGRSTATHQSRSNEDY